MGDAGFTAANGVTGGNGTSTGPFVIEGWDILHSPAHGIEIQNTTAYFVIRAVYVHRYSNGPPGNSYAGVLLQNVTNGRLEQSVIGPLNNDGIRVASSTNITIRANIIALNVYAVVVASSSSKINIDGNSILENGYGIRVASAFEVSILNNSMANYAGGVWVSSATVIAIEGNAIEGGLTGLMTVLVEDSASITVRRNHISNGTWEGVGLFRSSYVSVVENNINRTGSSSFATAGVVVYGSQVIIASNTIVDGAGGILIGTGPGINVTDNVIERNRGAGLFSDSRTENVVIARNRIVDNGDGIDLQGGYGTLITGNELRQNAGTGIRLVASTGTAVHHNNLIANVVQALDSQASANRWDDGYPGGGNFWLDYVGSDSCGGPAQNLCGEGDGLGDTPYVIDPDSQDRYPLICPIEMECRLPPGRPQLIASVLTGTGWADVTLTWMASADEGQPSGAAFYRVLRSANDPTGPYVEMAVVSGSGSMAYEHTCVGCGHSVVDGTSSFFKVQSVSTWGTTADSNLAAKFEATILAGTTLLAVPVQVANSSVSAVLQTLATFGPDVLGAWTYDLVDTFDPWKSYSTAKGGGDLTTLPFGTAFWLDTAAPGVYTVAGLVEMNPTVVLQPGWNLVAYASPVEETVAASLAGVPGVMKVQAFDPAAPYHLRNVPPNQTLVWGEAYWIYTTAGGIWTQG